MYIAIDIGNTYTRIATIANEIKFLRNPFNGADSFSTSLYIDPANKTTIIGDLSNIYSDSDYYRSFFYSQLGDSDPYPALGKTPDELLSEYIKCLTRELQESFSESISTEGSFVSIHPSWGKYKKDLIKNAMIGAGLLQLEFVQTPIAAIYSSNLIATIQPQESILVCDIGGSSYGLSVIQVRGGKPIILSHFHNDTNLSGKEIDRAIFKYFHQQCSEPLRRILDSSEATGILARKALREICIDAKKRLTFLPEVRLPFFVEGIVFPEQFTLTRTTLNKIIDNDGFTRNISDASHIVIKNAKIETKKIKGILMIGGSSQIPFIRQTLSDELNLQVFPLKNPAFATCLGLAKLCQEIIEKSKKSTAHSFEIGNSNKGSIFDSFRSQ